MIISGLLLPSQELVSPSSLVSRLEVGDVLTGRIAHLGRDGRGLLRFPDGSGFAFANRPALRMGESVQVQVVRLVPEVGLRLLVSSSGVAAGLAESAEQSLVRAPDIFANLLHWSGMASGRSAGVPGGAAALSEEAFFSSLKLGLKPEGEGAGALSAAKGSSLVHLLQKILPHVRADHLMRGDVRALVHLLEQGARQDVRAAIRQLRQVAAELFRSTEPPTAKEPFVQGRVADTSSELMAVRNSLHRLGDLLAMQEILPRTALSLEGGQLLGYRLFWMTEGGMGEAIWQKRQARKKGKRGGDPEKAVTTVLLSLNMTQLGAVQARLSYGEGQCSIGIAAEEESSLASLRRHLHELRRSLLAEEIPLHSLDIVRLMPGEMKEARMRSLGLASHFSTEA